MKELLLKLFTPIKSFYDFVAQLTAPMRTWPYGEDGKYIHILIGLLWGLFLVLQTIIFGVEDLNVLGMVIGGFVLGYLFEMIQEFFFDSRNTPKEQVVDAAWVMVGTTIIAIGAFYLGIIRLVY